MIETEFPHLAPSRIPRCVCMTAEEAREYHRKRYQEIHGVVIRSVNSESVVAGQAVGLALDGIGVNTVVRIGTGWSAGRAAAWLMKKSVRRPTWLKSLDWGVRRLVTYAAAPVIWLLPAMFLGAITWGGTYLFISLINYLN